MAAGQTIQRMRNGKHQVRVRHRQQFAIACSDPGFLGARLAFRAMAVAARVIHMPGGAALRTLLDMAAQCFDATGDNRAPRLGLAARERMRGQIGRAMGAKDLGQFHPAAAGHRSGRDEFERRQEIERRAGLGQLFLEVEKAGRGRQVAVPHQALDGVDVDVGFE